MTNRIIPAAIAATALGATSAFAGGLDRSTYSPSLMFKEGNYGQISVAATSPSVTATSAGGAALPIQVPVANQFTTIKAGYKAQISDKFALGIELNNNPVGVDLDYAGFAAYANPAFAGTPAAGLVGLAPISGKLEAFSTTVVGKYNISDRFSVYGGARFLVAGGQANGLTYKNATGTGFVVGAAYEIPSIAFRVSVTHESKVDLKLDTIRSGLNVGQASGGMAEATTLEFQSGIAKNTLVFGSVRQTSWSKQDVINPVFPGPLAADPRSGINLSNFNDSTTYTLGLGRKISDALSLRVAIANEAKQTGTQGPLAPTNGLNTISFGGQYTGQSGIETALGLSVSQRGDGLLSPARGSVGFSGSRVITLGLSVGKSF